MMKRMFIALDVPDETKEEISNLCRCAKASVSGISWVKPENIHLTLKFLGDVDELQEKGISSALGAASKRFAPFPISYGGVGHFGRTGSISAIWLAISEDAGNLARLAMEVERVAEEAGIPPEGKPFSPHLTLGRVREPGRLPSWQELKALFPPWEGKVDHTGFSLYRSTLTPSGPIYERLAWFGFTGR